MAWRKSTTPSVLSLSTWQWMVRKVPVRLTPSLQTPTHTHTSLVQSDHHTHTSSPYLHIITVRLLPHFIWVLVSCSIRDRIAVGWGRPCNGQLVSWSRWTMWGLLSPAAPSTISSFLLTMSPLVLTDTSLMDTFPCTTHSPSSSGQKQWQLSYSSVWSRVKGDWSEAHLSLFLQLTEHDYTATLELIHHPPEVSHCVLQWTLGSYVGSFLLVALNKRERVSARVLWWVLQRERG